MAAPAAAPPLVLDAHADTLDHVVRAVAHSDFLPEAVRLMLASPEHLHDPELLYRTRGVRGAGGDTLLMCAVRRLDVARAGVILGACPTPASRAELLACVNSRGWAALHIACEYARLDEGAALRMVDLLLANGADPLAPACDSATGDVFAHAIHLAACWSAPLVQRLVQAGASIDGNAEGRSTLAFAACVGSAQGVRMIPQLVALGARNTINTKVMIGFAKFPVEGAQPTDGEVVAALNALVSVGCSLTQSARDGSTPLDWAAANGNASVMRALLSLGVLASSSSLTRAVKRPELVRVLLVAGSPPDGLVDLDGEDCTALMEAVRHSVLESVEVLLAAGASVDLCNSDGWTALMSSIWTHNNTFEPRVTEALLATGADVNARSHDGWTALHCLATVQAQRPWAADAARLLLQRGADACSVDSDGRTPAQCVPAAQHGGELHRLLLEEAAA